MNTFPIKSEDYNNKFYAFGQKSMLPMFEWGEKLYMEYEGALRAVRPLYAARVSNAKKTGSPTQDGPKDVVCFDIAGIGQTLLKWEVYYSCDLHRVVASRWNNRIFKSVEDYERFIQGDAGAKYVPEGLPIVNILRSHGYSKFKEHDIWDYQIILWCWNYEEPQECPVSFKELWIDADGHHVTVVHEGWNDPKYKAYLTREECLAANKKAVVDFDEPEPEPEGIMDDTNGHEAELVRRINDAWNKYREEYEPILKALYERDIDEICGSDSFAFKADDSMETNLEEMRANWDYYAYAYLQHIADNNDLSTILHFLSYSNR